jgi:plastocyanin
MHNVRRSAALAASLSALLVVFIPSIGFAGTVTVSMMDNFFSPKTITINPGDTITWINNGTYSHSLVSDDGTLKSGVILPGQAFSATFGGAVGTYPYHDEYYGNAGGGMSGSVIVTTGPTTPVATPVANPVPTPTYTPTYTAPTSNTTNIAQLQAQVQALLAQIQAMQAAISGSGSTGAGTTNTNVGASGCPQISRTLQKGDSGADVTRLQQYLAGDPSVYPEALVTGYFGSLTEAAVQKWQTKYNIISSGTASTTGFGVVGPQTASSIAAVCAGSTPGTSGSSGGSTVSPVGGFISVTPVSGTAPLTANVTVTVNTTSSCSGATYSLNFGDNTPAQNIPVASGNCGQLQQTYQHIYQYGGTYQLTLSAGSHSTSATVTVAGPSGTVIPTQGGTGTTGGTTSTTPAGTISAFATSGKAPFKSTFYVSCVGGVAYNVVFGDGTDLGSTSSVGSTKCDGSLQAVAHTYTTVGSYQAQLVLFVPQANGTVISQKWGTADINVTGNADSYTYNPPTVNTSGSSTLSFDVQFDLPTSCTGYDLNWGDGTSHVTQTDNSASCASQTSVTKDLTHTYTASGTYTIELKRGQTLGRVDDVSVTITQ